MQDKHNKNKRREIFWTNRYGNTAQCGKSRFRENLSFDDGTFSQMYFVYLKKK